MASTDKLKTLGFVLIAEGCVPLRLRIRSRICVRDAVANASSMTGSLGEVGGHRESRDSAGRA
jgi:hypothetical protein